MKTILEIQNISKSYGSTQALQDVSFSIRENEVVGLIGNNGAGKSTLINILVGLLNQDQGSVKYNIDHFLPKQDVGVMCQEVSMPEKLKVSEWITMVQKFYNNAYSLDYVLKVAGIEDLANKYASALSGGQKRRVQFALSIVGKPKILFLDEPTVGMDFGSRLDFWKQIHKMLKDGVTVLLASHDLSEVESVVDRILMIDLGNVVLDEKVDSIRRNSSVRINILKNKLDKDVLLKLIDFASNESGYEDGKDYIGFRPNDVDAAILELQKIGISFTNISIEREGLQDLMEKYIQKKEEIL